MTHPLEGTHVVIRQISIKTNNDELPKVLKRAEDYLPEGDKNLINKDRLYGEDREKVSIAIVKAINDSSIYIESEPLIVLKTQIVRASPLNQRESCKFLSAKLGLSEVIYDEEIAEQINILKEAKSVIVLKGPGEGREINVFSPFDLSQAFLNPTIAVTG